MIKQEETKIIAGFALATLMNAYADKCDEWDKAAKKNHKARVKEYLSELLDRPVTGADVNAFFRMGGPSKYLY